MSATGYRVWGLGPGAYDVPLMAIEDQPWGGSMDRTHCRMAVAQEMGEPLTEEPIEIPIEAPEPVKVPEPVPA